MKTGQECILVVDDESHNANFLKRILQNDYEVMIARSGRKALELMASDVLPDIVLLDVMMQGINGFDVCSRLKKNPKTKHVPVIFLTAMDNDADKAKALNLGAIDYVTKPVNPELLKSRIRNYLKFEHQNEALQQFLEQQKENYHLLEASQANLEKAQAIANVGSLEWDIGTNQLNTSRQLDVILGTHLPSASGFDSFISRIHSDDISAFRQAFEKALNGKDALFETEHRIIRSDGTECIVKTIAEFNRDENGRAISMLATVQDISERYRIEQELRRHRDNLSELVKERTARINAILENAADGIITIDDKGIVQSYNHAAENIFLWRPEEVIGNNVSMLMPEPHRSQHDQYIQNFLHSGIGKIIGKGREVPGIRKNGDQFPLYLSISHVKLEERDLFTGILSDNSKYAKHQAELAGAKELAEKANQAKSAFLANMSHEIRTPMNAIIGLTQVVLETELDSQQRKHLQTVQQSSKALLHLLNEILDLSKLESGNMTLEQLDFDLMQTLDNTLSSLRVQAENKGLKLEMKFNEHLPSHVCGDSLRLRQVLTNLIGNAIKFTHQGKVSLKVDPCERDADFVYFSVSDTGIGISGNRLDSIFESFTQEDASTTRKFGGTGLGTTISKQLVELMGGRIWVESKAGKGSHFRFVVKLPASKNMDAKDSRMDADKSVPVLKRALKVLLAEDIQANIDLALLRLEQMGCKVSVAENGAEAIRLFETDFFDIILMDIQMPVMNGYDATLEIRKKESKGGPITPIIALTASAMPSERRKCLESGMNGFVDKPIIFENLFAEMAKLLPELFELKSSSPSRTAIPPIPAELKNFVAIDTKAALKNWQEAPAFIKALKSFAQNFHDVLAPLDDLLSKSDWEEAEKLAHKLKGVSGNLGMMKLAQLSAVLDNRLKRQENCTIEQQEVACELKRVLAEIMTLGEIPATDEHVPVDDKIWETEKVKKLVTDLKQAFDDCDPDQSETLLEELLAKTGCKTLQLVIDKADEFEFTQAEKELDRIISEAIQ